MQVPRRVRKVDLAVLLILLIATAAIFLWEYRDALIVRLLGPPRVALREAYQEKPDGPSVDHSQFHDLLTKHVDQGGWVDYQALHADVEILDRYILALGEAPFGELGRSEKLALLINAYNAFTMKLILEHDAVASIQDIPSAERWNDVRWNVGGHIWSLSQIEHEQIRPNFRDPRIHFALVCAAVGCPPLRNEAYVANRIEEQLQSQVEYMHQHKTWFQFDADQNIVRLTPLYHWYEGDFRQMAGSVPKYAARFAPALRQALAKGTQPRVQWLPYDWDLNGISNKMPR